MGDIPDEASLLHPPEAAAPSDIIALWESHCQVPWLKEQDKRRYRFRDHLVKTLVNACYDERFGTRHTNALWLFIIRIPPAQAVFFYPVIRTRLLVDRREFVEPHATKIDRWLTKVAKAYTLMRHQHAAKSDDGYQRLFAHLAGGRKHR